MGIEIGGTKIQFGVGRGDGSELLDFQRVDVNPTQGALGILAQIETLAAGQLQRHQVRQVAFGFGGPVDSATGRTVKSHQISGWDEFPLAEWCQNRLGVPATIGNDCDLACLAEACFGAGRHYHSVFYVTVGTGVGGGWCIDRVVQGDGRPAIAEIGHLRPGLLHDRPDDTVESIASGWGIVSAAQARMTGQITRPLETLRDTATSNSRQQIRARIACAEQADHEYVADLHNRCDGDTDQLTAKMIAQAAAEGNEVAREVFRHACQTLGWAIAQIVTILAPEVIVIGGGVSLSGEQLFLNPVKEQIGKYVFPPLAHSFDVRPAALGEVVVVHGALALAAQKSAFAESSSGDAANS